MESMDLRRLGTVVAAIRIGYKYSRDSAINLGMNGNEK